MPLHLLCGSFATPKERACSGWQNLVGLKHCIQLNFPIVFAESLGVLPRTLRVVNYTHFTAKALSRLRRVTRCFSEDSACSEVHTLISARVLGLDSLYQREQGRCLIYLTKNIKLFLHRVQRRNKHAEEGETEIRLKLRGLMNEINNTAGHFCPAVIVLRM